MNARDQLDRWCLDAGYDLPEYVTRYFKVSVTVAGRTYSAIGGYLDGTDERAARVALDAIRVDCKYGIMPCVTKTDDGVVE